MRTVFSAALIGMLLAGLVACPSGCHILHYVPNAAPTVPEEVLLFEPGKQHLRIPPYVFLSDFKLDPNLPLFRELANLRDQVSQELKLPTNQKLIRVYL